MIYACVKNGIVENLIIADAEFAASMVGTFDSVVLVDDVASCGMGFVFMDGVFSSPSEIAIEPVAG